MKTKARHFILLAFLMSAFGCATNQASEDSFLVSDGRPVENIYNSGLDYLLDREYVYAIREFRRVESQYPYSAWVRHALLMSAFTHYLINQYQEAITTLDRFIALYPGNADLAYAYYLRAMCFYEQIGETNRDSVIAISASQAFQQVVGLFPNSAYALDARFKLDLVYASLAAREMYLGRWAMERNYFSSALNRFRTVITQYNSTAFTAEALHRQVEIYLTIGLDGEARRVAAILGFNYPDSQWYKYSYDLIRNIKLAER